MFKAQEKYSMPTE